MTKITILGTGAMGSRFAEKLLAANYDVTVYNRTKQTAQTLIDSRAQYVATPKAAVKDADFVISMLTNDKASKSVWLDDNTGAIHGLKQGAITIESSTLSIDWIMKLSNVLKSKAIDFLDAPVVGSRPQAQNGQLIYLVGGSESVIEICRDVLSEMSSTLIHVGSTGAGTKMKLAVNAFFGVQVSALSEITGLMHNAGISKHKTIEIFNRLPTTSLALQGIGNLIAAENFDPLFPVNLVEKDFQYFLDMAMSNKSKLPLVTAGHETYKTAIKKSYGGDNIAAVAKLYL